MTDNLHDGASTQASRPVIIVFGAPVSDDGRPCATLRRRLDAALRAAVLFAGSRVIVTGGAVTSALPEALIMKEVLELAGLPSRRLVVEDAARTTLESSWRVAGLLTAAERRAGIVIVSSFYHVPRCRLCLRIAGLRAVTAITPRDECRAMGLRACSHASLRELLALLWNCLRAIVQRRRWE